MPNAVKDRRLEKAVNSFFPKCYNLKEETEKNDFIFECKLVKAESILKIFLNKVQKKEEEIKSWDKSDLLKIKTALKILKNHYEELDVLLEKKHNFQFVSEKDWQAMTQGDITKEEV